MPGILHQENQGSGMLLVSFVEMLQGGLVVSSKPGVKVPELDSSSYT